MTKARDLADIISGGFTVSDLPTLTADQIPNLDASKITTGELANARIADLPASKITSGTLDNARISLDAAEIPDLAASKITSGSMSADRIGSGTIADARIPNLAASKITSGTFADARIASSNVSQHATSFDDNKLINDISTLALRQASNENKAAYNTNSMYVDVFQDTSGYTNVSNTVRNSDEYVNTIAQGTTTLYQTSGLSTSYLLDFSMSYFSYAALLDGSTAPYAAWRASPSGYNQGLGYNIESDSNFGSDFYVKKVSFYNRAESSRFDKFKVQTSIDSGSNYVSQNVTAEDSASTTGDGTILQASNSDAWQTGVITTPVQADRVRIMFSGHQGGNGNAGIGEFRLSGYTLTANATGSFTSNTITASSSVSSMGAIITYQDHAGTNTLNTDIIVSLSADNGSNFATATLTALPDFATGIKMAKVNDLSVTAGTQLKYKIAFANQAAGSKEARIRGVSLQY
tara:strand:- start:2 stop:1390 length:1389 start_codon:yes stop_codon:yes gene_type:complete